MKSNEMLFRCHSLSNLMTDSKGKSNMQKYSEALISRTKYQNDYLLVNNKDTKTAQNKLKKIQELNNEILTLESIKGVKELSETCIKQIIKTYASTVRGRYDSVNSKYFDKGKQRENNAITLLSSLTNVYYKKNTERLFNDYVSGEVDVFFGEEIRKAKKTIDTKCSWSYITFLNSNFDEVNPAYEWQGHAYMWLTGAEEHDVAYCLVNGTTQAINDEIRKLSWEMGVLDASIETEPEFVNGCRQIERNHIFDINEFGNENPNYEFYNPVFFKNNNFAWDFDIPKEKRVKIINIKRDEFKIEAAKERIIEARVWAEENLFKNGL